MKTRKDIPLKIFNASAGSGKTYQLVKEYIKLLIHNDAGHQQFAQILAMTFTNKAALEMKQRIIFALDEISHSNKKKSLITELSNEAGITEQLVIERCGKVLTQILHRYEDFNVMTIDKFNLRLIKSFSRDLELPTEFEVVMNEVEMIEKIVDEIMSKLGTEGAEDLSKLIFTYAKNNVDEGARWSFRNDLIKFGQILNKEQNKGIVDRLLLMDFSVSKRNELYAEKKVFDNEFATLASALAKSMEENNIQSDLLPGKSRTYKKMVQLADCETVCDEIMITPSFRQSLDQELKPAEHFPDAVKEKVRELISYWDEIYPAYDTLSLFLKNFFNMALLQYIAGEIKHVRSEEQKIRISEFNTLISELIRKENALYIYERLGNKFHHFLLDEFQDTSRLQWLNLVPLVKDSLANMRKNLIVGDPKQSIYRFKNGVAEQFVELPGLYNPEKIAEIAQDSLYFQQMGEVLPLKFNWRSAKNIVEFNNSFFNRLKGFLSDDTVSFYNSVDQIPKSDAEGRIRIVSKQEKIEDDVLVDHIERCIKECKADGIQLNDICILGKRNKDCNIWAIELTKRGYKVVSADSLLIKSDLHVQLTIAYLYRRLHPHGQNEMKRFAELYFRLKPGSTVTDYLKYIIEVPAKNNAAKNVRLFNDEQFLRDHFGGSEAFFSSFEGLYDLIEKFYHLAGLHELQNPYLHHLADLAFGFGLKKGPDLQHFLEEYERTKGDIAVQVPESTDAVQIMTMHKAKGLEFPVVILPSMNFDLKIKGSFLVDAEEFILYKKPGKNETIAVLKDLHDHENQQVLVDNLNICYVAMTRPEHRLYVFNYYDKDTFGQIFHTSLDAISGVKHIGEEKVYDYIPATETIVHKKKEESINFHPVALEDKLWFPDIALQDSEEVFDEDHLSAEQSFGRQFHALISKIQSKEEISVEITHGIKSGEVDEHFADDLRALLTRTLDSQDYQALFIGAKSVLNEQSIIVSGNEVLRPDKIICKENETIIVDYKTGEVGLQNKHQKHFKQVLGYKSVLEEMGFPNVTGYLFYIGELRLERVG